MLSVLVWFVLLQHNTELVLYKAKEPYQLLMLIAGSAKQQNSWYPGEVGLWLPQNMAEGGNGHMQSRLRTWGGLPSQPALRDLTLEDRHQSLLVLGPLTHCLALSSTYYRSHHLNINPLRTKFPATPRR